MRPISLLIVACLTLPGCGVMGEDKADPCGSISGDVETLKSSVKQTADDINAMGDRPQPKLVDANYATDTPGVVDDSAGEAWDERREAMIDEIKSDGITIAHLVVDHPSCFSDLQVARAKTALDPQ